MVHAYAPGRGAVHGLRLLEDYRGIIHCDRYQAYPEAHVFVLGVGGIADGGEVFGIAWHRRRFPDDNDRRSRAGREAPASPGAVRSRRRR